MLPTMAVLPPIPSARVVVTSAVASFALHQDAPTKTQIVEARFEQATAAHVASSFLNYLEISESAARVSLRFFR